MKSTLITTSNRKNENLTGAIYLPRPKETKEMKWFDDTKLIRKGKTA